MINICFVCLGNICRSPMAEFICKSKIKDLGLTDKIYVSSLGISDEEVGHDMYPPAQKKLKEKGIAFEHRRARQLQKDDYFKYDYFVCMEDIYVKRINMVFNDKEGKVITLLPYDIDDPWYTDDFETTYNDINKGVDELLNKIIVEYNL